MSDTPETPDARPAPQYGEYATPEEVARITGRPAPGSEPAPASPPPVPAERARDWPSEERAPRPPLRWDPPVTIALLLLGLWNVISAIPSFWNLDRDLAQSFAAMPSDLGVDLSDVQLGEPTLLVGRILLGVWVVLFLISLGVSVSRLRARRRAFWIPIVASVVAMIAVVVAITVIMFIEPGLAAVFDPATGA
ncbi:DUF6264 family protein [uncultured Schumannella sp.]|uniref:DUF6264 family protein n=1 Tax=uncultured Schumannella sp. TaxID=1195956 RepID=UPI0025FE7CD1|nr:DUF6264 family protein [uncultured Schumannella sp.]